MSRDATYRVCKGVTGESTVSNLGRKRLETTLAIAGYAVGGGMAAAAPGLGGKIPTQLLLTTSDILLYTRIWKIYFDEDLSNKQVLEMLTELGLVTAVAAGVSYVASRATTAILMEINNWLGPVGWGATAAIAGSITGLFGAAWAVYCDNLYSQKQSPTPEDGVG
ncbi:hypothetical protein [Calothrix sp. 336/3]|uniref:hypothetical protein n=1 Tax=Calothrix sp. 336/3 TaxID=1337936 RepID=UPI000624A549|nr:hypothetical protein [Calothrix sp. 336/3]AKG20417.1 hypothetical protein IJ00_02945 [Calothrix sp. 336/3]